MHIQVALMLIPRVKIEKNVVNWYSTGDDCVSVSLINFEKKSIFIQCTNEGTFFHSAGSEKCFPKRPDRFITLTLLKLFTTLTTLTFVMKIHRQKNA